MGIIIRTVEGTGAADPARALEESDEVGNRRRWEIKTVEFHRANPHVYKAICDIVEARIDSGAKRISMMSVVCQVRDDRTLRTDGSPFKVNQNFSRPYAKMYVAEHPDRAHLFEFRD